MAARPFHGCQKNPKFQFGDNVEGLVMGNIGI
jgi:hypothetical protein